MKICPACGKENEDAATVCVECSAPLTQPEPAPQEETVPEVPETPKKSKKGLWIGMACAVVAIAAIVVGLLALNNPTSRVTKAFAKTAGALDQQVSQLENLEAASKLAQEIGKTNQMTERIDLSMTGFMDLYFHAQAHVDRNAKITSIDMSMGVTDAGEIRANASATPEGMRLSVPQLLPEKVLTFSGAEMAELFNQTMETDTFQEDFWSQIFEAPQADGEEGNLTEACAQALADYAKSLKAQSLLPRENEDWTYYALTPDAGKKQALLDCFEALLRQTMALQAVAPETLEELDPVDEIFTSLGELDDPVVAIDKQGYLVCLELTHPEDGTFSIRLTGGENPWSSYELWDENGKVFGGTFQVADGVLSLTGAPEEEDGSIEFTYDDNTGDFSFRLTAGSDQMSLTGSVTEQDGSVAVSLELPVAELNSSVTFGVTVAPLAEAPQPPQGEEIAWMQLPEDELAALQNEMNQNVMADKEIMGLLSYFLGDF